jgi:ketosteroid isomerase-like protein
MKKHENAEVDLKAEKAAITGLFDKFYKAFHAGDAATMASFIMDDALCLGTDPAEIMSKQQVKESWKQIFDVAVPEFHFIGDLEIKLAADGNSATAVSQYIMPEMTPIPWRTAYHVVKIDDHWMILVLNISLIPKNDDLPKLNAALE